MDTATIAINRIYEDLDNRFTGLQYNTFSTHYLGRNNTYFSYLKSSGAGVSVEALFNLYAQLLHEEEQARDSSLLADNLTLQTILVNRADYFCETKNLALDALIGLAYERHGDQKEMKNDY
jgi:hypothetical protein